MGKGRSGLAIDELVIQSNQLTRWQALAATLDVRLQLTSGTDMRR
jgi:hypothetical protein